MFSVPVNFGARWFTTGNYDANIIKMTLDLKNIQIWLKFV